MFVLSDNYYTMDQIETFLDVAGDFDFVKAGKGKSYANVPASFDIETTSFLSADNAKCACMYIWQFGINGKVIIGRTWEEYKRLLYYVAEAYNITTERRMIIYVHNLSFEFQFIRRVLKWDNVFATDVRKPLYALTKSGFEFRCSYRLSGYSLKNVGKNLLKYKVLKKVGDLDYAKIRTYVTPLSHTEIMYCIYDVLVVMAYIQEEIEREGTIADLPYTKTGYVRKFCRDKCFGNDLHGKDALKKKKAYHKLIRKMTLTPELYSSCRKAFQGGFTHCNPRYSGKNVEHVHSIDFTSSYPYVMVTEKFPMSTGFQIQVSSVEEIESLMKKYCLLFDVRFLNLESSFMEEQIISESKCSILKNKVINNGRVVRAADLKTTCVDLDWKLYKLYYKWDAVIFENVWCFTKDYLPKDFVLSVLEMYGRKTKLKGIKGEEVNYMLSKNMTNSTYGMSVTNPVNDVFEYVEESVLTEWTHELPDIEEALNKYNKGKKRFLYYAWGIWVTAYARYNLLTSILEFGKDYVYSDTDSIKFLNYDAHCAFIAEYDKGVFRKIFAAAKYHGISPDLFMPANKLGETKPLGVWDWETEGNEYQIFKSLGAKRYLYLKESGEWNLTVSGVSKALGIVYMTETWYDGKNPLPVFDAFNETLVIPTSHSGRIIPTYIDTPIDIMVTDYLGNTVHVHEESGIYMEAGTYSFSISQDYKNFLMNWEEMKK